MRLAQDRSTVASMPMARCRPADTGILHRFRKLASLAGCARHATSPGAPTKRESRNFLRLVSARRVQDLDDVESFEAIKL